VTTFPDFTPFGEFGYLTANGETSALGTLGFFSGKAFYSVAINV
jgi:hypothetical protein